MTAPLTSAADLGRVREQRDAFSQAVVRRATGSRMDPADALAMVVEAARRKCHEDHKRHTVPYDEPFDRAECSCGTVVMLHEVRACQAYDPEWRELAPGEFAANGHRYPPHTAPEERCTHTVEFTYCSRGWRALYGVNVHRELCELWAD